MKKNDRKRIVILGGGFAGLEAARNLPDQYHVTLIDTQADFEFLPNIHELVSGIKDPLGLRLSLADLVSRYGHRFVHDQVVSIDPKQGRIETRKNLTLPFDALILAVGGVDETFGIQGVSQHAIGFKSVDECDRIVKRLSVLASKNRPFDVVIIGGGLEGVETIGEILRRHRDNPHCRVHLVEASDRLMPGTDLAVDYWIRKTCAPYPVSLYTGRRAKAIGQNQVLLDRDQTLVSDLTIWTGGIAPPRLLFELGLTEEPGQWFSCEETLQSPVNPALFGAGDVVALSSGLMKQAYRAMDMGRLAAKNIQRWLKGKPLRPFKPASKPILISFGDLGGFFIFGDKAFQSSTFTLAKELIYQSVMASYDRPVAPCASFRFATRMAKANARILLPAVTSLPYLKNATRFQVLSW